MVYNFLREIWLKKHACLNFCTPDVMNTSLCTTSDAFIVALSFTSADTRPFPRCTDTSRRI